MANFLGGLILEGPEDIVCALSFPPSCRLNRGGGPAWLATVARRRRKRNQHALKMYPSLMGLLGGEKVRYDFNHSVYYQSAFWEGLEVRRNAMVLMSIAIIRSE